MTRPFIIVFSLLLGIGSLAHGQRATERYIPLGQSPGVSGKTTLIGSVGTFDDRSKSLAVQSSGGSRSVELTPTTHIWLDRSAAQQPTVAGATTDLRPGRRVEVKFTDDNNRTTADWIKIDTTTSP